MSLYPCINIPRWQFCILKHAMVLDECRLKTVELMILSFHNPFKILALASGSHVNPLHLDDEGEAGSAVETSSLQSRHRHSPG